MGTSGTPFIALLEPTALPWERHFPPDEQPHAASIPRTFIDAMKVRTEVFVREQQIPQENEFDSDDARCAHWVIYASVNKTVQPAVTDPATGEILRPRQSETQSLPIGTLRLVPFPHAPHPVDGGVYVDEKLVSAPADSSAAPTTVAAATAAAAEDTQSKESAPIPPKHTFAPDRPTTFHDGVEPYVKLGRLAVLREFRGRGIAAQLVRAALDWIRTHPDYFDPSPAERGFEQLGMEQPGSAAAGAAPATPPKWDGLVCCHAQEGAVNTWKRCGFQVDEGMGKWFEEGISHVGMFLRVEVDRSVKQV